MKHYYRKEWKRINNHEAMRAAIDLYLEMGFPIIPCSEKRPLLKGWPNLGVPEKEEALSWLDTYPNPNLGLVLGSTSGIIGIDVDGDEALSLLEEISCGDLPITLTFITPGGGLRYLYRLPNATQTKKWAKTLEGEHSELVLMGDGQQTIVPPSVHPNGKVYEWVEGKGPGEVEISMAPQWMLDLMSGKKKISKAKTPTEKSGSFKLIPPEDPAYIPFIESLKDVADYGIDSLGNLCAYNNEGTPYTIANFVARPVMDIIRDDGVNEFRTFRLEGLVQGGIPLRQIDIPASDFLTMNWPIKYWGIEASIRAGFSKKDLARDAIQNMGKGSIKHRIYTHLGFRKTEDGKWIYLHFGGCIGDKDVSVDIHSTLSRYTLPDSIEDLIQAARASLSLLNLAPPNVTVPLLALVYLSPLVEAFRQAGLEPNFLVWLHGITGTRKTSLAMVFLSHFCSQISKTPPASFKDTANALERRAFVTKDSLLLIDDYHPEVSSYESQKMAQTAQRLLRMYGDRIARGRLTSAIEFQKEFPPRGMALVTGEDQPKGQSSIARYLAVEILKNNVDLERLTASQNSWHLHSQAMVGYIRWLIPKMDVLPQRLSSEFRKARILFQAEGGHGRLGETAAWLHIGFKLMLEFMQEIGACSQEKVPTYLDNADEILLELINKQNNLVSQEKPAEIFLATLSDLLASGEARTDPLDSPPSCDLSDVGRRIGWHDDIYYYLLPGTTYNHISKFLGCRGATFPLTEKALWRHLDQEGLIQVEDSSSGKIQRTIKKTIKLKSSNKSVRLRLVHLRRSALEIGGVDQG